ncbi:MAG: 3-oxoacyl-ACP reductase FabG [Clostridia bacterium]|nr:3-oxoacyl-ACP reductase FabG [Clostridia bacterium]
MTKDDGKMQRKRTALITGGARGIGRQIALDLGAAGYNVVVNYNKSEKQAMELINELSAREIACQAIRADVSDAAQVKRMAEQVMFGTVDTLVNNAGIAHMGLLQYDSEEDFDRVIGVDLKGVWLTTRQFLPGMIANGFGRVINISSFWAERGSSTETAYSAAKAGVNGLTKALSREVGEYVTVNAVIAGLIATEMNDPVPPEALIRIVDNTPVRRIGRPEDVSNAVLFLADEKSSFVNGALLHVDGGY